MATERGESSVECKSRDIDEIMYFIFKENAMARGRRIELEKRLAEGWDVQKTDDRRIAFPLALERIGKIREDWRVRLEGELMEILEHHPYRN